MYTYIFVLIEYRIIINIFIRMYITKILPCVINAELCHSPTHIEVYVILRKCTSQLSVILEGGWFNQL